MKLSRLSKISLRQIWQHEALDFTQWLAKDENLSLLGKTLNLDLRESETERPVSDFYIDILARDQNDNLVIIENQLAKTDHDHLGKIITYASVGEANTIVWIVEKARDEHKQAIEWLNQRTDSKANFFLLELEVWQIDDSAYAPKFNIIVAPNNWSKTLRSTVFKGATPLMLARKSFWQGFINYADQREYTPLRNLDTPPDSYGIKTWSYDDEDAIYLNTWWKKLEIAFWIKQNKEVYQYLFKQKELLEKDLGEKLIWKDKRQSKEWITIGLEKEWQFDDTEKREKHFKWLYEMAKRFDEVFPKHLAGFKKIQTSKLDSRK